MGELWIVLAVSCGLAFLSEKYTFAWNGRPSKVLNYGIVVLLIAYLSLFAGLRTSIRSLSMVLGTPMKRISLFTVLP